MSNIELSSALKLLGQIHESEWEVYIKGEPDDEPSWKHGVAEKRYNLACERIRAAQLLMSAIQSNCPEELAVKAAAIRLILRDEPATETITAGVSGEIALLASFVDDAVRLGASPAISLRPAA